MVFLGTAVFSEISYWMYLSSPSMAFDTRFPPDMTNYPRTCV